MPPQSARPPSLLSRSRLAASAHHAHEILVGELFGWRSSICWENEECQVKSLAVNWKVGFKETGLPILNGIIGTTREKLDDGGPFGAHFPNRIHDEAIFIRRPCALSNLQHGARKLAPILSSPGIVKGSECERSSLCVWRRRLAHLRSKVVEPALAALLS